jgi:rhodanese-related sulfurtransferase
MKEATMKKNGSNIMILTLLMFFLTSAALAQYPVISSEQLRSLMEGTKNGLLVDVRMPEEYQAAHIPGAINIPADRIRADRNLLPKDRATQIALYCRGIG